MFDDELLKRQARLISHSGLAECAAALAGRTRVEDLKPKNFAVTSRWSGAVPLHRPSVQRLPQTPRNTWRGDLATQRAKTTRWTQPLPRVFRGPARCACNLEQRAARFPQDNVLAQCSWAVVRRNWLAPRACRVLAHVGPHTAHGAGEGRKAHPRSLPCHTRQCLGTVVWRSGLIRRRSAPGWAQFRPKVA